MLCYSTNLFKTIVKLAVKFESFDMIIKKDLFYFDTCSFTI